jgi:hypothetical protein
MFKCVVTTYPLILLRGYFLSDDLTDLVSPEETLHPFVVVDHPGLTAHLSYMADTKSTAEKEGR